MTEADHNLSERRAFAVRLLNAAGRVEAGLYRRPVTLEEIRFRLRWADALTGHARRLYRQVAAADATDGLSSTSSD